MSFLVVKKGCERLAQGKTREEVVRESMDSPKVIDPTIDFKIHRSPKQYNPKEHKYKCMCCGAGFNGQQKNNFQRTLSPLFQSNDGFLPWCKDCTDKYMILLTAFYSGNEEHAIEHFCQQVDWVYDFEPLKCAREISSDRSRISHYAAKKNLNTGGRKTYFDSLKFAQQQKEYEVITTREQTKDEDVKVKGSSVDRWGLGFNEMDYKNLDDHYFMLKKNNPNADNNQEIFIKSLCNINMLMVRALQDGDSDKYVKLTEQYSKTFTKAGLKTIQEVDNSADECLGVTLATISQFTPEEYYKDRGLYKDFDKIGEYFTRFVKRPLKNLMTGSTDRDHEYYVKDKSGDLDD